MKSKGILGNNLGYLETNSKFAPEKWMLGVRFDRFLSLGRIFGLFSGAKFGLGFRE